MLILDSRFEEIERLESFLHELQQEVGYGEEQSSQIRLAVNEAVTNAITHGNKEDPAKQVTISASVNKEMLNISVQDEGPGFNPEDLDDPLKDENLLKDSGRGIFLIKQSADEVAFTENATKLTMRFEPDAK